MHIAVIPVGYADGLNRKLGNQNGQVFIKDTACRIIGDISMDSFVADISEVYAQEGQEVTIFSPKSRLFLLREYFNVYRYFFVRPHSKFVYFKRKWLN